MGRKLITDGAYGPDTLKVMTKAYDDAWTEIKPTVTGATSLAATTLAHIVLSMAIDNKTDPEQLKNAALRIYRLTQPTK